MNEDQKAKLLALGEELFQAGFQAGVASVPPALDCSLPVAEAITAEKERIKAGLKDFIRSLLSQESDELTNGIDSVVGG